MTGALIAAAVVAVGWAGLAYLLSVGKREHQQAERELARVRALSPADAKRRALQVLRDGAEWQVRPAVGPPNATIPPAVSDLLGEYEEIVRGEFWIGRSALREPARLPGFIKVGGDFEYCELMVKDAGLELFSSYVEGEHREKLESSPTIWHKILEVADE
jgi:hypothetical protein